MKRAYIGRIVADDFIARLSKAGKKQNECLVLLSSDEMKNEPRFTIPVKLYRIGEVVRFTPFSRQTIHNYTTMGLIHEADWTDGGHRLYDESVFQRLAKIMELRKGKTLAEIKRILTK